MNNMVIVKPLRGMYSTRTEATLAIYPPSWNALALVLAALLLTIAAHMNGATINAASPALLDVSAAISSASDGDTVVVPAGTADWTSVLTITKGITLVGATTVTNAGTQNPTVSDLTIIQDGSPLNTALSGLIQANLIPSQSFRLTGFTFTHGSRNISNNIGVVHLLSNTSSSPHLNMRVDHCHFDHIYGRNIQIDGWIYGVADHNYIVAFGNGQSFYTNFATYGGSTYAFGHGSWADFPWFGTNKFFFMEDNTIVGNGIVTTSGAMDGEYGARFVARHNYFINVQVGWHGTEGGNRGGRCAEVYDNTFHWPSLSASSLIRSGTLLQHDNTWDGIPSGDGSTNHIVEFREMSGVPATTTYGVADGTSIWDMNDTEGNGTYVEGHSPHLFNSGTASSGTTPDGSQATVSDSSKNWTPGQWVGYSITQKNPSAPSYNKGSFIISNTATSITFYCYTSADRGPTLQFTAGDAYQIHRLLTALDQGGRGKGDLLSGGGTDGDAINTVTGVAGWAHEAQEPLFSWNNVYNPGDVSSGFASGNASIVAGRDYYNLARVAADTTPSQVSSTYVAALNGADYTGTYTYPHPLVNNVPGPPPNLRIIF
jgi:hypothetical protein